MVRRDRQHQRGLPEQDFGGIRAGPSRQEQSHDVHVADAGSGHQHGLATRVRRVRVRFGLEQGLDEGHAAIQGGQRQRRDAVVVGRVHIGA